MAHENLKQHLVGKPGKDFVTNLTLAVYDFVSKIRRAYGSFDFIHYRIFEEVTVREYTEQKNKWGDEKPEHYRFDCVIFIEPHQSAINQRQTFTVGVELKNSKGDLMGDAKIEHYLGYTDFFFIGVPSNLVADAVGRAKTDDHIGVFDVETGRLCKMPARIHPTVERKYNLLEQIMYSRMFDEDFKNVVSVKVEDVEVIPAPLKPKDDRSPLVLAMDDEEEVQEEVPGEALREARTAAIEADREAARQKEQIRREKHDAKVAALKEEVTAMNEKVPAVVASILEGLSLNDQRIYHAIRRNDGVQAQYIAEILPYQEGVERPSIATVKRSISSLTKAGLIEREGSKKTGQYIIKKVDCAPDSCQVCAKSPLCTQFRHVSETLIDGQ
jgi:predicted transcriptional regulator